MRQHHLRKVLAMTGEFQFGRSKLNILVFGLLLVSTAQAATTYTVLHHFGSGQDGASPLATLTPDAFGNFYGTTGVGGADRLGTVFELIPSPGGTWRGDEFEYRAQTVRPSNARCAVEVPKGVRSQRGKRRCAILARTKMVQDCISCSSLCGRY